MQIHFHRKKKKKNKAIGKDEDIHCVKSKKGEKKQNKRKRNDKRK